MKLKYKINTIINFNDKLRPSLCRYDIDAIVLENKCICIYNSKNILIFNKIYRLIHTIDLDDQNVRYKESNTRNIIPLLNYPNLFAVRGDSFVSIYEIQLEKKKKVTLKFKIDNPKKFKDKELFILPLSSTDILYFCQDNFFLYNIKSASFTYKKFCMPIEKKYESLKHEKYIIKLIEYRKNELIILLRDIIYGVIDEDMNCEFIYRSSILLYDLEKGDIKKIYKTTENTGILNTYMGDLNFTNSAFSNYENIFVINNSIAYIKDNQAEFESIYYSLYIINILNGDIKYKFDDYLITSKSDEFFNCGLMNKSIHLCDNIFLFNGFELRITKNRIEQNKVDIIYGTNMDDKKNNKHYYLKLKNNLILLYNDHEIKICHFAK